MGKSCFLDGVSLRLCTYPKEMLVCSCFGKPVVMSHDQPLLVKLCLPLSWPGYFSCTTDGSAPFRFMEKNTAAPLQAGNVYAGLLPACVVTHLLQIKSVRRRLLLALLFQSLKTHDAYSKPVLWPVAALALFSGPCPKGSTDKKEGAWVLCGRVHESARMQSLQINRVQPGLARYS